MKKSNNNVKHCKFVNKIVKRCVLIQIAICLFFAVLIYESKPADSDDCTTETLLVEDKNYIRVYREYKCQIISNGIRYDFPNTGISGQYTAKELYETIQQEDNLDVTYVIKYGLFGTRNLIVDAREGDKVYLDVVSYNAQKEKAFKSIIIIFSIIELVFFFIVVLIIGFNSKKFKSWRRNNRFHRNDM